MLLIKERSNLITKTEISIKNNTLKIEDIQLIYTENNYLVICTDKRIKILYDNVQKAFNHVVTQILLSGNDNFVLLLTGNNMVNINKIVNLQRINDDLKIETTNHVYILNNANCMEYMCLKSKLSKQQIQQEQSKQ